MGWNKSNSYKATFFQVLAAVAGNLMAVSDGMTVGWTGPMIPYLLSEKSHIRITKHDAEWLETWLLLGSVFGIPTTIYFVEKIGRKKSLLLASFCLLIAWIGIGVSDRIEYIYVSRVISGISGDMAFVAAPMYTAEIADQNIRGFLSSIIYIMMITGVLTIYTVGPFFSFYVPCIIGVILLFAEIVVFSLMPESPYYLLFKGDYDGARQSLQRFRSPDVVEKELIDIMKAVERQKSEKGRPQDIFMVKSNFKAMIIMTVLNTAQQLGSINVILMNMHTILEAAGSVYVETPIAAIMFAAFMLIAVVVASITIDKLGRKKLIIISSILTAFCLLSLAIYFNLKNVGYDVLQFSWVPIVSVMIYAFVFKFGLGMAPIVITAEIFATKVKAIGMTLADAVYVLAAIVAIQIYQVCLDSYGMHLPFYIFSLCSFLTAVFVFFFIPETKGKTLDEIQFILKGQFNPKKPEKGENHLP